MNTFSYNILQPKKEVRPREELVKQTKAAQNEPQLLALRNAKTSFEVWKSLVLLDFQYRSAFTTELFDGSIPHFLMADVKTSESYRQKLECQKCRLLPNPCYVCRTVVYWLRTYPPGVEEDEALAFLNSIYRKEYHPSQSYVDYKHSIDHSKDRVVVLPRTLPPPLTSHPLTHQFTVRVSSDDPVSDRVSVIKRVKEDMSHTNPLFHTNSTFGLWQTRVSREWKEMWSMTQAYHGTAETRRVYTPEKLDTPSCPTKNCYYCAVCQLYIDDAKRLLSVEEFNHLKPVIVDHVISVFHSVNGISTTNTTRLADTLLLVQQLSSNHKRKRDDDIKPVNGAPAAAGAGGGEGPSNKRMRLDTPSLSSSSSSKDEKKSDNANELLTLLLSRNPSPNLILKYQYTKFESSIEQEFEDSYSSSVIRQVLDVLYSQLFERFEYVFIPVENRKQPSVALINHVKSYRRFDVDWKYHIKQLAAAVKLDVFYERCLLAESLYRGADNKKMLTFQELDELKVDDGMIHLGQLVTAHPIIGWLDLKETGVEWTDLTTMGFLNKKVDSNGITDIIEPLTASDYSHLPSAASHISRDLHHSIMTEGSC